MCTHVGEENNFDNRLQAILRIGGMLLTMILLAYLELAMMIYDDNIWMSPIMVHPWWWWLQSFLLYSFIPQILEVKNGEMIRINGNSAWMGDTHFSPIIVVFMTAIMVVAITALPLQSQEPGRASQQTSQQLQHQLSASETRTVKSVFNLTAIWNSELLCSGTKHCRSVN